MNIAKAKAITTAAALALTVTGCARSPAHPPGISIPADPTAALAVVIAQPQADHSAAAALVAGSAQTGEHLEIVSGSGALLNSGTAPAPPVIASPVPPPSLPADPTQFQADTHRRQLQTYDAALAADHRALARALARLLSSWATTITSVIPRTTPGTTAGSGPQPGISSATSFFASLQQAGMNLGTRRVIVIFGAEGPPAACRSRRAACPGSPSSSRPSRAPCGHRKNGRPTCCRLARPAPSSWSRPPAANSPQSHSRDWSAGPAQPRPTSISPSRVSGTSASVL